MAGQQNICCLQTEGEKIYGPFYLIKQFTKDLIQTIKV